MNRFFTLLLAASCLTAVGQVPDYVPTDGLVVWLPLNGDFDGWSAQNVSWDVVGTSNGTDRFGLPNAATSFNGSSDWASSSQSLIPTEGDFTISIWLLGHDNGLHAEGIAQGGSSINSTYIGHTPEGNIRVGGGGNWAWDNLEFYPFDVWTHFVVTKTASISTLYLNGEVYSTSTAYTNPVNSGSTYLGKQQNPLYTEYWDGLIDDVGIWHRALNPDEITALYNWSPTQGCLDESACNFDEDAVINDNSCDLFSCRCLDGTIWSEELGGCIVANPSDSNFDGCVQLNDLLDLLGAYGNCGAEESVWQCGDPLEYQGYEYATVQIGEQCWFAENLRAENYRNGDAIPASLSDAEWAGTAEGAVSVYDEDMSNLDTYGRLYNWYAVDDPRALCPLNWKIATNEEWSVVVESVASDQDLISQDWVDVGTNTSGFSLLPGGKRDYVGEFALRSDFGYYWTSTEAYNNSSFHVLVGTGGLSEGNNLQSDGMSIRCIKDPEQ